MDCLAFLIKLASLISEGCLDAEKLPGALISCGVVLAAAALFLIIYRAPGGIFLHCKAPYLLYYGFLIAVVIFGFFEASAGFWVSGDGSGRRANGEWILLLGTLPIVLVAAISGFNME